MAGFNRIILIGNLTRDPEHKQLTSGQAVCRLGLASNRQFKNRQTGAMVQEVCYIDVDVWGPQAESCKQYLQKGRPVLIEGRIKFDSWEDANGQTRSKHSIVADRVVFLGGGGNAAEDTIGMQEQETEGPRLNPNNAKEREILDTIEQLKQKTASSKVATPAKRSIKKNSAQESSSTGEISFKDEQPFQDDLPF